MPLTDREISLFTAIGDNSDPAGSPIVRESRLSTSSSAYGTIATWTVSAANTGDLHEVSMISDNFSDTEFRLTINGVEQFTDQVLQTGLSLPWRTNRLAAGAIVLLEGRSPDNATALLLDGSITGTERAV